MAAPPITAEIHIIMAVVPTITYYGGGPYYYGGYGYGGVPYYRGHPLASW